MAGELTFPILPSPDLDRSIPFYEALGFRPTYRQRRPNPYAVVARDDIQIHLFGVDDFDPSTSLGNVIVAVPDPDALYESFASGLRAALGRLPSAGIPRILRPRKRFGTVRGFSVIDPGGNWLRLSKLGDTEDEAKKQPATGLARVVENAARQGDARGHDGDALEVLDKGLARFPDALPVDRVRALLYRAELGVRLDDRDIATSSLAEARTIPLTAEEQAAVEPDLAHATELVAALAPGG
jgi:catechol 2,3-dioxygenase-like lactoylglutathione lyase family enzyme